MENESKKPRLQIRLGGLILLIILALILFKVDIKDKVESEKFQKNVSYISDKAKDLWEKYIIEPFKSKTGEWVKDLANDGIEKIQDSVNEKTKQLINTDNIKIDARKTVPEED